MACYDGFGNLTDGRRRPDPDNPDQGFHAPFYGARSKLFAVTKRHELAEPPQPAPGDQAYIDALKQVRNKGIAPEMMGTLPAGASRRTEEQTMIGVYWGYDGAKEIGTPPRLYNQIVRKVALKATPPEASPDLRTKDEELSTTDPEPAIQSLSTEILNRLDPS